MPFFSKRCPIQQFGRKVIRQIAKKKRTFDTTLKKRQVVVKEWKARYHHKTVGQFAKKLSFVENLQEKCGDKKCREEGDMEMAWKFARWLELGIMKTHFVVCPWFLARERGFIWLSSSTRDGAWEECYQSPPTKRSACYPISTCTAKPFRCKKKWMIIAK